jgi:pilus assembly protein Flp/PilA
MFHGLLQRLFAIRNEDGATAVEYGLMVALIAAFIILTVKALGEEVNAAFQAVVTALPF